MNNTTVVKYHTSSEAGAGLLPTTSMISSSEDIAPQLGECSSFLSWLSPQNLQRHIFLRLMKIE